MQEFVAAKAYVRLKIRHPPLLSVPFCPVRRVFRVPLQDRVDELLLISYDHLQFMLSD